MTHRGIRDREALQYWREYGRVLREGNPLGLSFVEYVAARVNAEHRQPTYTDANAPWYMGGCGHFHPMGESCSNWTLT